MGPVGFFLHSRPLERLLKGLELPSLEHDLRRVYTEADHVLYADTPGLVPLPALPPHHHFLGPIPFSLPIPVPASWDSIREEAPVLYWNLGSSGADHLFPVALEAFGDQPISVIAGTAGAPVPERIPKNFHVDKFVPGKDATARADLVICNGGTGAVYAALAEGVPVIAVASNMDQYLFMENVERAGAGITLRAGRLSARELRESTARILGQRAYRAAAQKLSVELARFSPGQILAQVLEQALGEESGTRGRARRAAMG
jgi:UDP:flavonoid glycosyltransferase YjiC (YdhE family)